MKIDTEIIAKWGARGSLISGSRFVRDYCKSCGQPIRVLKLHQDGASCEACSGEKRRLMRESRATAAPLDDVTGYQANAIRAMEE